MTGTATGDWSVAVGTARGSTHVADDRPNQDAHAVAATPGATVVAVADGHGGARYVRSDRGSRFAVDVATEAAARWWTARGAALRPAQATAAVQADLVPEIVAAWRARVADDFAGAPPTDEENARAGADIADDPPIAYGSTLLLAILGPDAVLIAQLGDGDVFCYAAGAVTTPLPEDDRLVAGATTSLCTASAADDFRVVAVDGADVELLVAATDGYGNSFADADWRDRVAGDLARQLHGKDARSLDGSLSTWVAESADAGGDDVTVAVATRPPSGSAAAAADATVAVAATTQAGAVGSAATPAASTRSGARSRAPWVAAIVAGIVGLGAGAALGIAVADEAQAPSAGSSPVESTSTTTASTPAQAPRTQLVADADTVVEFNADKVEPQPTLVQAALGTASWITALQLEGGGQWQITDTGDVRARDSAASSWRGVDVNGLDASSLTYDAGHVWVVARGLDGFHLVRIDPGTRTTRDWQVPPSGSEPVQQPDAGEGTGSPGGAPRTGTSG